MRNLEDQLRRYGDIVENTQEAVSLDEVMAGDGEVVELIRPTRHRGRWVWAVVGATVVVLLGVIPMILSSREPSTATQPTPTVVVPETTATTSAATTTTPAQDSEILAGVHDPSETLSPISTDSFGQVVWSLYEPTGEPTATQPGVYVDPAGGYTLAWLGDDTQPELWHSDDGRIWVDHPNPDLWAPEETQPQTGLPGLPGEPSARVVQLPDGGYAAYLFTSEETPQGGGTGDPETKDPEDNPSPFLSAEVMTSQDGVEWISHGTPGFIDVNHLDYYDNVDFVFTSANLVTLEMIQYDGPGGELPEGYERQWTSVDGLAWTQGPPSAESRAQTPGTFPVSNCADPIWDLVGWPCDPESFNNTNFTVSSLKDGLVISVGTNIGLTPLIAVSVDGKTWETISGPNKPSNGSVLAPNPYAVGDLIVWTWITPSRTATWLATAHN